MADNKVGTDAPPASVPVPLPANTAEVDTGSRIRDELIKDHNIDNSNYSNEKISEKNSKPSSSSASDSDDLAVALTKSNVPVRDEDEEKNREAALQRLPAHERDILKQQLEVPESKINYISLYRYATAKDLLILFVSSLAAIVSGALLPLMTIIFGTLAGLFRDKAIGTIGQAEFNHRLSNFTLYFVYLLIGMFFFTYVMTMGFLYLGESLTDKIREHYLKSLLRQNIAFYDKLGPGAITFSLTGQMALIQKGLSEKVGLTLSAAATFVTAFIIGFIRSAKLTGILVSIIVALTLDMSIGAKFMVKYAKKSIEAGVYGGSVAEEVLSAVRDTTAFSTQDRLSKHYDSYLVEAQKWGYKKAFAEALFIAGMFFVVNSNYALSFWEGSRLIVAGEATLSAVLTVLLSVMIGSFSLGNVAPNLGTIFGAVSAAAPIYACIDRISPINSESEEGEKIESVQGNIEFRNIKHIYPSRPEVVVMPDFSAVCPAGKTTALVGLSGSGKSTVIGLLERFYRPVGGEVLLDGVNIEKLNIKWLRQQISLVSQEPVLFAQTIIDNVANGLVGTEWEHASEEKKRSLVEDACKLANAHDFILSLPEGYDTNVGDKGYLMSGGQRQRIAIARAVISQPKILLLDEATSALDTSAEAQVQLALDRAAHGRTTITIAHRLSTIKNADNIIVMAAGQIIEQGTHTELLQKRGNYFNLVQAQSLNAQNDDESDSSSSSKAGEPVEEADKNIREELQRTRTSKSVRSMKSIQKDKVEHYNLWQLFKFIVSFNRPELGISIVGFIISVFHGLITPAQSVLFSKCITAMSVPPSQYPQMRKEINLFAGLFFMLACLHSFSYGSTSAIFGVTSERLTRRARLETFRRFLRQDIGWFDREENSAGSLVSYLSTETTHLAGISGTTLSTIIGAIATVVGAFILSISIAWKLGLVVSACLPILISCGYLRFAMLNKFNDRAENAYQEVGNYACEATSLIRTVLSLTREEEISRNYHLRILNERRRSIATIAWSASLYAASQSLNFGIIALAFWYGGTLLGKGEYSTFQFFLAYSSIIFASQSVGAAFAFSPDISSARNAAKRMIVIFNRMSKMDWEAGDKIEKVEGSIEFRDVQFSFPTRPNQKILKGLNLSAKPGEYIALVGPSGCGKSTTIALAERFYEPSSGGIYVDGRNIADLNVNEYRSHLALVSQEPVLYHGSIKDNIVLGVNRDVTDDEINHACKQANIYDFIQSLPEGFGTVVGSKGSLLSGGQKQRICIARALIRNPRILLLDEATSALDSESEKVVQDALDVAAKGRTTIAIAHRLSTIQKADTIYVFENGRIVESGGHKELMDMRGKYFELVNLQSLSK